MWASLALTLAGAPAQAQFDPVEVKLVGNLSFSLSTESSSVQAQPIRTGSAAEGYTLTEVRVGKGDSEGSFRLHIVPGVAGQVPDLSDPTQLIELIPPATFSPNSVLTFSAPADTTLASNSIYHVVVSGDTFTESPGNMQRTAATGEDLDSARGWSIGDSRWWRNAGTVTWSQSTFAFLRIELRGIVLGNAAPRVIHRIPDQYARVGEAFRYTFAANTFFDQEDTPLTYTATKRDGTALPSWLSFDGGTRTFSGTPTNAEAGELTVRLTASDGTHSTNTRFVLYVNSPAQGKPVITGVARMRETLSIDLSGITDPDGISELTNGDASVLWIVEPEPHDPNVIWIVSNDHTARLGKTALEGRRIRAEVRWDDDQGYREHLTTAYTLPVAPQQLIITGDGKVSGSRCTYTFPLGDGCVAESAPRDVGPPLVVRTTDGGVDVTSQATFSVTQPSTLLRRDEFGHLQRAHYHFSIDANTGQLRTVPGKTYPHAEVPICTGTSPGTGHDCDPTTISTWSIGSVGVRVTATTPNHGTGVYWVPVWVTRHPAAVRVNAPNDLRCNGQQCYGRALAPGQTLYGPGGAQGNASARRGDLELQFRDAPEQHDGRNEFTVRVEFSEPVLVSEQDMRDHIVRVWNGTTTQAHPVAGQSDEWEITIAPDGENDTRVQVGREGDCEDPGTLCTLRGDTPAEPIVTSIEGPGSRPLSVELQNVPASHDGETEVSLDLVFSDAPSIGREAIAASIEVDGATKGGLQSVNASTAHFTLPLTPTGGGPVTVTVPPTVSCTDAGAICTESGERLEAGASVVIPGPEAPPELTAEWQHEHHEHDGVKTITVDVVFNEAPVGVRNRHYKAAIEITGGTIKRVRAVNKVERHRRVWIEPSGPGPVTLALNPTDCDAPNALCTASGGKIERRFETTVPGLVAISVADAEVEEGPDAVLEFEVSLDRARIGQWLAVYYQTEDGTATAGEDYTAVSGSLVFGPGETSKTVEVPVIDDAHDEDLETMTLRLSNPIGAQIADGEATGTIRNTDHMPQAWLGRFGRTVADQVLAAVEDRTRAPRTPGSSFSIAGHTPGGGVDLGRLEEREAEARLETLSRYLGREAAEDRPGLESRVLTPREMLVGSSFAFTAGTAASGFGGLWGRGALSSFNGREGDLTLDGEVASAMLGADFTRGPRTAGVVLTHSLGEGGYRSPAGNGEVESTLTGLYPYGRFEVSKRATLWGVVGYGAGTLTLTPEAQAPIETDMDLKMAALGLRGTLLAAPPEGGAELALTSDVLGVRTSSDEVRGSRGSLAASEADVTRLRLGLEGTWRGLTLGAGTLEPRLEVGVRHDGGDAETGFGLDLGGGLAWTDPGRGFEATVHGRGLLTHESAGFGERGFSGSLAWDPAPASDRGASLRLTQTVGGTATGGMEALLRPDAMRTLDAGDNEDLGRRRLEATAGYGFAVFGGWTGTPELGLGWSDSVRETTLGWRLAEARRKGLVFGLDVEGTRSESVAGDTEPEHRLGLGLGWRLESRGEEHFEVRVEGSRLESKGGEAPDHELTLRLGARW